jgi:uncharacterized protein with ACT and thioredoxin-like domain
MSDSICLSVRATDRPGLLRDLAGLVADHGGNIVGIRMIEGEETEMHLDVAGLTEQERLCEQSSKVPGVLETLVSESASQV